MRVLLTGAEGAIGRALLEHLRGSPDVESLLVVGGEPAAPATRTMRGARGDGHTRVRVEPADLRRSRPLRDLLFGTARAMGIDTVVHGPACLGPALRRGRRRGFGGDAASPALAATRELVLACEEHPTIRHLVYLSAADVYALRFTEPNVIDEDQPLELDPAVLGRVRDAAVADLTVCARLGGRAELSSRVLRLAEVLAPDTGSQLWDYLQTRVCLRPLGFDPMINVLSIEDCVRAVALALRSRQPRIYNIPGADTLPLSRVVARWGRIGVPVPGPLLAPLYRLRTRVIGLEFRYDLNMRRFHFGGVLDGSRAWVELGYQPEHRIVWPVPGRGAGGGAARGGQEDGASVRAANVALSGHARGSDHERRHPPAGDAGGGGSAPGAGRLPPPT